MAEIKTILFPTDYSDFSNKAFPYAASLAKAFDAKIILLHITDYGEGVAHPTLAAVDTFDGAIETVRIRMRGEAPHKYILDTAREKQCDLIAMATHGRSALSQFFLGGSLAEEVVRYSSLPVFVVKVEPDQPAETYTGRLKEILFTTDLSEPSERAFAYAAMFARKFAAKLFVLHIVDEDSVEFYKTAGISDDGQLKERVEEFVKTYILSLPGGDQVTSVQVSEGRAETEIVAFAEANQVDLIAMSTHGHTGIREDLVGSTTDKVIRQSSCPVLAIRG